jgi:hypothetical protein
MALTTVTATLAHEVCSQRFARVSEGELPEGELKEFIGGGGSQL